MPTEAERLSLIALAATSGLTFDEASDVVEGAIAAQRGSDLRSLGRRVHDDAFRVARPDEFPPSE